MSSERYVHLREDPPPAKRGYDARKLRELHFDALIALTARAVGALVITCNGDDFEKLRDEEPFDLLVWRTGASVEAVSLGGEGILRRSTPMSAAERRELEARIAPVAARYDTFKA